MKRSISAITVFLLLGVTAMSETKADIKTMKATFAGGCFWCMQPTFNEFKGVISTRVGYTGGHTVNPTYEEVSSGTTGHAEGIEIIYDPTKVTYAELVEEFWHNIDPTSLNRQFADSGTQYRSAIFYHDEEQKRIAEASKERLAKSGKFKKPIVTEITAATTFYPAEEYHQDYYKKNAMRYKAYKIGSGRAGYLEETWGKH
jgi:peptide-methionine (S)-S-oxide reductase